MASKSIYNTIKPTSHELHIEEHIKLGEVYQPREENFSNIHDCIMANIGQHIKLYGDQETYNKLWSTSLFPERLTKAILRAMEQYIDSIPTTNATT
jgi:hypothetical protein